jgi:hypothetical protein
MMGVAVVVVNVPHTNYELIAIYLFMVQNRKMVVGSIDQLSVAFEEGCEINQLTMKGRYQPFAVHVRI